MKTRRTALGLLSSAMMASVLPGPGRVGVAHAAAPMEVRIRVQQTPFPVAPAGIFFEAELSAPADNKSARGRFPAAYQSAFHEMTYIWTLPGQDPRQVPEHLVAQHRRGDQASGPFIGHVFDTPGAHPVSVEVIAPDGRRGTAEVVVEIGDPTTAFGAAGTIVVSADGTFDGAPPHDPRNAVRDLRAAHKRYSRLNLPGVQILLKRGQTHQPHRRALAFDKQASHCHIGAWGGGDSPVLDQTIRGGSLFQIGPVWGGKALVLRDLDVRGGWDPTTEMWQGGAHDAIVTVFGQAALTLHNCRETGCALTVNSRPPGKGAAPGRSMTFLNAHSKTDFKDFLLLSPREGVDISITGCKVVQNLQALNGGENRKMTSAAVYGRNAHNFFRGSARRLYIASNDLFARHGWARNFIYDNHLIRLNRNNAAGMRAVIVRNHIEGAIARQSRKTAVPMNMLIEQNYIVASPTTKPALSFAGGAATVRNNIVLEHDTPKFPKGGRGFEGFVGISAETQTPAAADMPYFIYNNSFIVLRKPASLRRGVQAVLGSPDDLAHVQTANNLIWGPHLRGEAGGDGPLETTPLAWNARYRGGRLGWAHLADQVLARNVFPGDVLVVPYWQDFFGTPLGPSDFAGTAGRHVLRVGSGKQVEKFDGLAGQIAVRFAPNGVQVHNLSGARWPKGAEFALHCDRGKTPTAMQTRYGQPAGTLSLYRPLHMAGAFQSGGGRLVAPFDFLGQPRAERPSRGAVEPL